MTTTTLEHVFEAMRRLRPDFVIAGSQRPPDDTALDALEARLGVPLPLVYRELARNLGPLVVEAREEVWPETQPYEVGPFWSFCRGLELYAIAEDAPPELDVEQVSARLEARTGAKHVVVMRRVGDPQRWVLGADGRVRTFDPRDATISEPEELADVLMRELEALRRGCDAVQRAIAAHGDAWRAHL